MDWPFLHSTTQLQGGANASTWSVGNVTLTFPDGTALDAGHQDINIRDKVIVRESASHGSAGIYDGHWVKFTLDVPYMLPVAKLIVGADHTDSPNFYVGMLSDVSIVNGQVLLPMNCDLCAPEAQEMNAPSD